MRFRNRLLLVGVPLLMLPVMVTLAIFSGVMTANAAEGKQKVLEAQLGLVRSRIQWDYDVLSQVGFATNDFYRSNALKTLQASLPRLMGPNDLVAIFDHAGGVVLGPEVWLGKKLAPEDPLRLILRDVEGSRFTKTDLVPSSGRWLIQWARFAPWNWVVVVLSPEYRLYDPIVLAIQLSSLGSGLFLALSLLVFAYFSRRVSRPLANLQALAQQMGRGNLHLRAPAGSNDELGQLGREWNAMAEKLATLTQGLEVRVAERTKELEDALDLTQRMQNQLVQSEKMAALGQLVSGIAHELNTPLGAISSSNSLIGGLLGPSLVELLGDWAALSPSLREVVLELHAQGATSTFPLLSAERVAPRRHLLATLEGASVRDAEVLADELIDAGVLTLSGDALAALAAKDSARLLRLVSHLSVLRFSSRVIDTAIDKATKVIQALRVYSRFDAEVHPQCVPLADNIEMVLTLFHARLRSGVEVTREFVAESSVEADPDRLSQLWINLIGNALHAMGNQGHLDLSSEFEGDGLVVRVADSGPGIPADLQPQIFTPYFTTKKRGEGTGLGLSICRSIVEEFGGALSFRSVPGSTVFEVRFPKRCP